MSKYILSSLNSTTNVILAVTDAIRQSFQIDPSEIKYDTVPSIKRTINSKNWDDQRAQITERVISLCESLSKSYAIDVKFRDIEPTDDGKSVTVNITINDKLIQIVK